MPKRVLPPDQQFVQLCPNSLSPEQPAPNNLELSQFIDVEVIQSLMNDFYSFAHIPMAIVDMNGEVLAGVGWQEICTGFHRVHPDTCRNCVDSDTRLTVGIRPGEYRLYKCRNNMWDVATPLMLGQHHIGNVFAGQFFFDDEPLDREYFLGQAVRYGFDERHYIAALEAVPRLSRRTVETGMAFMTKLAHILSEMSHSNFKMSEWMRERRQAEEALIRSEKLASVGRLAATVAHEINNPLEAATNCLYLIHNNENVPPELKGYLDIAERELQRVAHIAKQTLGFYRENTRPTAVDVARLVDEVAGLYSPKLEAKELRLKIEHGGHAGLTTAVAGEIRQVISNLLTNAIDATMPNGTVKIRTSRVSLEGCNYTRITVADSGTGVCPNNRNQLFKPFFTTKESVGTGLGLWVSKEIVTKHDGRIRMRSAEGRGTVFSVFLPQAMRPLY